MSNNIRWDREDNDVFLAAAVAVTHPQRIPELIDVIKIAKSIFGVKKFYKECGSVINSAFSLSTKANLAWIAVNYNRIINRKYQEFSLLSSAFIHVLKSTKTTRSGGFYDQFWIYFSELVRAVLFVIAHDAGQLDMILGSAVLNPEYALYYSEEGKDRKSFYMPSPMQKSGLVYHLSIENNSCYCDTLLQYMFGYTDLFDFMFRYMKNLGNFRHPSEKSKVHSFRDLINDPRDKKFIMRFKCTPPRSEAILKAIHIDAAPVTYDEEFLFALYTICQYTRTGQGDYKQYRWIIRNATTRIFNPLTHEIQADYSEFYESVLSLSGIIQFAIPRVLVTVYMIRNVTKENGTNETVKIKLLDFTVRAGENISFIDQRKEMVASNSFLFTDPGAYFNFSKQYQTLGWSSSKFTLFVADYGLDPSREREQIDEDAINWKVNFQGIDNFIGNGELIIEHQLATLPSIFYVNLNPLGPSVRRVTTTPIPITRIEDLVLLEQDIKVSSAQGEDYYNVTCVVFHAGSSTGGHYTMLARDPMTRKWVYYNDALGDNMNLHIEEFSFDTTDIINIQRRRAAKQVTVDEVFKLIQSNVFGIWYTRKSVFDAYSSSK
jgi:hypothetical protein